MKRPERGVLFNVRFCVFVVQYYVKGAYGFYEKTKNVIAVHNCFFGSISDAI